MTAPDGRRVRMNGVRDLEVSTLGAGPPGDRRSRSRIIEDAARDYLAREARLARDTRDREIIDQAADALNAEMEDVLSYQADL